MSIGEHPTIYTGAFFDDQIGSSQLAARLVLPLLFGKWLPDSVVDVGCGLGPWCAAAMDLGVPRCIGLDGSYVPQEELRIPAENFVAHDLLMTLPTDLKADLVICVEVAEHLPAERAESFVRELAAISDIILFAAAIPYQGGTGHCNEHWLEYWSTMFAAAGMDAFDPLRDRIWHDRRIPVWYRQNLVMFGRRDKVARCLDIAPVENRSALSRVHPEMYLQQVHRDRPTTDRSFGHDDWFYLRALEGDLVSPGYGREYDVSFTDHPENASHGPPRMPFELILVGRDRGLLELLARIFASHPQAASAEDELTSGLAPEVVVQTMTVEDAASSDFSSVERLRLAIILDEAEANPLQNLTDGLSSEQALIIQSGDIRSYPESALDGMRGFAWLPHDDHWLVKAVASFESSLG